MEIGMRIRKPVAEVYDAVVNPAITTQFWFTKRSGRRAPGAKVEWVWERYHVSPQVTVTAMEPNRRIAIEWPGYSGRTAVAWQFLPQTSNTTFVRITERGFCGNGDELAKQVADSTQGVSLMRAGLKALLGYNVRLNLVADRYPAGLEAH